MKKIDNLEIEYQFLIISELQPTLIIFTFRFDIMAILETILKINTK